MRLSCWILAAVALVAAILTVALCAATPAPASAGIIPDSACKAIGDLNGLGGKACSALSNPKQLLKTGKSLITGHLGNALRDLLGGGSSTSAALSLAALVAWIVDGARTAVHEMGKVVNETSAPQLGSVWFSSTYWRIAAVSALLTLPFLFAAAVQALVRSDLSLLARAAFSHLPIALVGVGIAAPVTMLLLSGTDELCSLVWSPSSSNGLTTLFAGGGTVIGAVALAGSPFLAFLMCLFTAAAAILVWLELAMREAAVYIVVLLLPLAFAALVWPARRVWAVRVVEILVALILSKFAIVAVLGLGGAALDQAGAHGLSAMLAGMVLVLLAALAPWAVLRLVPLAEVASSAASALRPHTLSALQTAWPSARTRERAERGIAHVAGDIGDLVRFSSNGHSASPQTAASNGHSRNGRAKADEQPYNWEDDARHSAAQPQAGVDDETEAGAGHEDAANGAGLAMDSDAADLAGDAGGADAAGHFDRSDLADTAGLGGAGSADASGSAGAASGSRRATREERIPGADPHWQAPDLSWDPLHLGMDQGWPPDPPWPAQAAAAGRPENPPHPSDIESSPATSSDTPGGPTAEPPPDPQRQGAEQSDPLPPAEDRGGPL
ncbi:MAG TPA: hypothetical protein VFB39_04530 [Solirubrobacteraceae bacterium]|nr:hypothetical protein [Solirubrobacteraceae bacterium]